MDYHSRFSKPKMSHFPRARSDFKRPLLVQQENPWLVPFGGFDYLPCIKYPHKPCKDQSHFYHRQVLTGIASWSYVEQLQSMSLITSRGSFFPWPRENRQEPAEVVRSQKSIRVCRQTFVFGKTLGRQSLQNRESSHDLASIFGTPWSPPQEASLASMIGNGGRSR